MIRAKNIAFYRKEFSAAAAADVLRILLLLVLEVVWQTIKYAMSVEVFFLFSFIDDGLAHTSTKIIGSQSMNTMREVLSASAP